MHISPGWCRGKEDPVSGSTIFISAFLTTVPHEPDLISKGSFAKAKHIANTDPASVIPALGDGENNRGDEGPNRNFVLLYELQEEVDIKFLHNKDPGPDPQAAEQNRIGVDVEERQGAEHHILVVEVEMRVFSVHLLSYAGDEPLSHDELRIGRLHLLNHLRRREQRIRHRRHSAAVRRAEEREHELRRVRKQDHDGVAVVDPYFMKPGRDFPASELHFSVGIYAIIGAVDEAGAVSEGGNVLEAI
nr:polyprotein [Ipomoea batatas]